jgi:VanZ family protein
MFAMPLGAICIAIVSILLVAGLAPFHAPKNQVAWLKGQNGLQFKRHSSIVSAASFPAKAGDENFGETLELLLRPSSLLSTNTILAFDAPSGAGVGFVVRQYKNALVVRQPYIDGQGVRQVTWPTAMDVFSDDSPLFVTIALGKHEMSIYLNGALREAFETKGNSVSNLSGRLVMGNSTDGSDSWTGQVLGLAMYHTQLTSEQVAEHYTDWTNNHEPAADRDEMFFALYLFNESRGKVVHNLVDATNNLIIPNSYFLLHPRLFSSIKRDYKPTWQYWEDVSVNVAAFVPLGFFVSAYFSEVYKIRFTLVLTIVLGFLVSFTIESLQFFLPTRSSGSTDLITNTLGTAIGIALHRSPFSPVLLSLGRKPITMMKASTKSGPETRASNPTVFQES